MKRFGLVVFTAALLTFPVAVQAKTMALLVGVADYNEPSGIHDLLGPRNDVTMIWRALKKRGVGEDDVTVLTDGLPAGTEFPTAAGLPQSANILAGLDRLAERAEPGDTVLFYYSGHGTRQPDNPSVPEDEPETDGMDQVILPADVGAYDPIKMTLKNAIIDDELGRKINAIRAKGALVWAVVDACHSGTVTRGDTVTRSVDPATLGIPMTMPAQASRGGTREGTMKARTIPGEGGLVGFYAVESYDEAIERPFPGYNRPMVGEGDKQRMGVFTYLLHRALSRNVAATYRELAQEIVSELNMDHTGGKVPPPVFDGDLDAPLPGSNSDRLPNSVTGIVADGAIAFPIGTLQGFDVGAGLALYAPGASDKPVAHATVTVATAVTSRAEDITWEDGATPVDQGAVAAVVAEPAISFRFVVSPPPSPDTADAGLRDKVEAAMAVSFADGAESIGVEMGEPGNPDADVLLRVKDGRLWVVRPDRPWVTTPGAYDETPSLALDEPAAKFAADLKTAVWRLARAAKLVRVASALGDAALNEPDIAISGSITRAASPDARAICDTGTIPKDGQPSPVEPLLPAAAGNCDFVDIEVTNDSDQDYYIAGFYVDSLGGVATLPYASARTGCVRPLPAGTGKALAFKFWIDTWDEKAGKPSTTGAENFVVLAVPKDRTNTPPRLCALTQPTLSAMQQTRSVEMPATRGRANKLATLLGGVEGMSTRGASAAPEDDGPALTAGLFVFDVKP